MIYAIPTSVHTVASPVASRRGRVLVFHPAWTSTCRLHSPHCMLKADILVYTPMSWQFLYLERVSLPERSVLTRLSFYTYKTENQTWAVTASSK